MLYATILRERLTTSYNNFNPYLITDYFTDRVASLLNSRWKCYSGVSNGSVLHSIVGILNLFYLCYIYFGIRLIIEYCGNIKCSHIFVYWGVFGVVTFHQFFSSTIYNFRWHGFNFSRTIFMSSVQLPVLYIVYLLRMLHNACPLVRHENHVQASLSRLRLKYLF